MLVLANIFQPLIDVFDAVIRFFHDSVGLGWGLSIIFLTIAVRTVLIPLTLKQFGSCLPLLLQLPVFLSLFYMLRKDLKIDICAQKLAHLVPKPAISIVNGHHHVLDSGLLQKTACGTPDAKFLFIHDITTKA